MYMYSCLSEAGGIFITWGCIVCPRNTSKLQIHSGKYENNIII